MDLSGKYFYASCEYRRMTPVKDGGPAFPHQRQMVNADTYAEITQGGMTIRDYFAGQALAGLSLTLNNHADPEYIAKLCFSAADAMLKERTK